MIESIQIKDIATYGNIPESMNDLSNLNFFFGSNGSGKTTITRVIANESVFPSCEVKWKGGTRLQAMVYNRDFIAKNFNQLTELKGIFTLGEKNVETLNKIAAAKNERDALTKEIESLNATLQGEDGSGGKKGELAALDDEFKNKCWAQKQKHDAKLFGAFEGFRGSAEKFKGKVLQEQDENSAILATLTELEKRAETVFGPTPTSEQAVAVIEAAKVIAHEFNPILSKQVIGRNDVDIAAMIRKLGNSDWVKEGRTFYEANEGACPFCQQSTMEAFAQSLNEYFDETFVTDSKAIDTLSTNYAADSARLQQQIASAITSSSKFLDIEKLKTEKELLDSRIAINIQRLASKTKEPSHVVKLESVSNVASKINELIDTANTLIAEHNKMVENISKERRDLTAQVWKYLLEEELKADLAAYGKKRDALAKSIDSMTGKIASATKDKSAKIVDIQAFEKQTTSIQPTIDQINALLSSFGFRGFSLAKATNGTCYKLVRGDGADAKETLSEEH